jgi:hypothetical protein
MRTGVAGGSVVASAAGTTIGTIFYASGTNDVRYINYSQRVRIFIKFAEVSNFTANCFYYLRMDTASGAALTIADPTARSIGFRVNHLSGSSGQLRGVIHDGTTLTTSSTSFGTITNRQVASLVIDSLGNGTVNYYLNGTLVGTMTGGPTGLTASGVLGPSFGVTSGGDATDSTLNVADLQIMVGEF